MRIDLESNKKLGSRSRTTQANVITSYVRCIIHQPHSLCWQKSIMGIRALVVGCKCVKARTLWLIAASQSESRMELQQK